MILPVMKPFTARLSPDDGPLLLTLLMGNNNNNEAAKAANAIPDILDPRFHAIELNLSSIDSSVPVDKGGPQGFAAQTRIKDNTGNTINQSIPDVLELRSHVLELNSSQSIKSHLKVSQASTSLKPKFVPSVTPAKSVTDFNNRLSNKASNATSSTVQLRDPTPALNLPVSADQSKIGHLSDEQLQFWRDNGYLVMPNTLSDTLNTILLQTVYDVADIMACGGDRIQTHSYLPGQESYVHPIGRVLATLTDCAFEPDVKPLQRIQRLGCAIHRVIPQFREAIMSSFHRGLAQSLGYTDPRIIQSLVIIKAAEVGARVVPHQDGCSGFTEPPSCTTFWYALEDSTIENGCLAVAPGSHRVEPITRRCKIDATGMPEFADLEYPVYANINSDASLPQQNEHGEYEYKKLEVKAGTLILMHGNLMHTSDANRSNKSRIAFNFGIVEGLHDWLADNYLQPYEGETEFEKL